jgi:hypothetical protein
VEYAEKAMSAEMAYMLVLMCSLVVPLDYVSALSLKNKLKQSKYDKIVTLK